MSAPDELTSWEQLDDGLVDLAHALGATQGPREAQFNAQLDELTRRFPEWGIPTEAEALAWADERELES